MSRGGWKNAYQLPGTSAPGSTDFDTSLKPAKPAGMDRVVGELTARRAALITAFVCLTPIVSHSIGRSVYGLLLKEIKTDLGLTNARAGWPSSGIFILYVVGVLVIVVVSPRIEPVTIMRTALGISVGGLLITATAQNFAMLTIGVALVGGAGAGIWMTAPVLATEYVSERRRGLVIGALTSTMGLANILFGLGTTAWRRVADDDQLWRPVWWVAFAFTTCLLVALVAVARFSPTDRISARGIDFSIIRRIPRWREVTVAYALFGGMSAGFGTFIVVALREHGGVSKSGATLVFSAMGVAGMLASPLGGALSDRVGRLTVLRFDLLLLLVANVAVAVGGPVATVAGAILYAAGASTFPALIAAYVRDSLDSRSFSQALAIMTIAFSVMAAIMTALVGVLGDVSFAWSFGLLAVLPAVGFLVLALTQPKPYRAATQSL